MTFEIILQIILFGIALSMDSFAVSVTEGLTFTDINKKKSLFIAAVYGIAQAIFPLAGFWLVEGITRIVGSAAGEKAGTVLSLTVTWISFALLIWIGIDMIVDAVKEMKKPPENKEPKLFSVKEVIFYGFATAIDALATGVAFHNTDANGVAMSTTTTIWLHAAIIMACTFLISLAGVLFGRFFEKLFKGKFEITGIVGGVILIGLGVWVVLSHYLGI